MIKTCDKCYYYDKCKAHERCSYYDPIIDLVEDESEDNYELENYIKSLKERQEDYNEIIEEVDDDMGDR